MANAKKNRGKAAATKTKGGKKTMSQDKKKEETKKHFAEEKALIADLEAKADERRRKAKENIAKAKAAAFVSQMEATMKKEVWSDGKDSKKETKGKNEVDVVKALEEEAREKERKAQEAISMAKEAMKKAEEDHKDAEKAEEAERAIAMMSMLPTKETQSRRKMMDVMKEGRKSVKQAISEASFVIEGVSPVQEKSMSAVPEDVYDDLNASMITQAPMEDDDEDSKKPKERGIKIAPASTTKSKGISVGETIIEEKDESESSEPSESEAKPAPPTLTKKKETATTGGEETTNKEESDNGSSTDDSVSVMTPGPVPPTEINIQKRSKQTSSEPSSEKEPIKEGNTKKKTVYKPILVVVAILVLIILGTSIRGLAGGRKTQVVVQEEEVAKSIPQGKRNGKKVMKWVSCRLSKSPKTSCKEFRVK